MLPLEAPQSLLVGDDHPGRHLGVHAAINIIIQYIYKSGQFSQLAELALGHFDYFLLELLLTRLLVVDAAAVLLGQPVRIAVYIPAFALHAQQSHLLAAAETLRFILLDALA